MSLNTSFAPNETSEEIWIEVSTFIGDTVLSSASFGILISLYIFCMNVLVPQLRNPVFRTWTIFHIIYCTLLVVLIGIGAAANVLVAQIYWISNRDYPGGPLGFLMEESSFATLVLDWSVYIIASWLQDGYVIYRCLVIWDWNYFICGLPVLCLIGSVLLATSIALIIEISRPSEGLNGNLSIDFVICWYIFSVSINVLATLAIVGRLLWMRRTITNLLGREHSKTYIGVVAMLIESAFVYSAFGIIFVGTYFRRNPVNNIVLPILGTLEGICPLMIIYRVACGRGWTSKTMQQVSSTHSMMAFRPGQITAKKTTTTTRFMTNSNSIQPAFSEDLEMESIIFKDRTNSHSNCSRQVHANDL